VIFGGWVNAKGGNESARLAWVSQEVLNGLISKKYKSLKEEGRYEGQEGGYQWRQFTFKVPHSKLTVQVYARQVGKKVWLRVGPSEPPPPAVYSLSEVTKMRTEDLKALHLLKRKFGRRLSPHYTKKVWEADYNYSKDTADE
jgi:hypothetical protein